MIWIVAIWLSSGLLSWVLCLDKQEAERWTIEVVCLVIWLLFGPIGLSLVLWAEVRDWWRTVK